MNPASATLLALLLAHALSAAPAVNEHFQVIRDKGQQPHRFIEDALKTNDLIIFDDAIHSAQEPFDFYQDLIRDPVIRKRLQYVFVEVFSIAQQKCLDAYFSSTSKNEMLLAPLFQEDYSGYGWRYQTYLDLLSTIWDINSGLADSEKLKVIGVSPPVYWEALHTREDYDVFLESLLARDYFMYQVILSRMDGFKSGKKGFFLTNTRHAYKHLRSNNGNLLWNTATFFGEWHPAKTLSVRLHNVSLSIQPATRKTDRSSAEGLEQFEYKWVRIDEGSWDAAFEKNENLPVALMLKDDAFGRTKYIGNLMLQTAPDQTMADAYDAVIFLAPLSDLHISGQFTFLFTPEFKTELKRRILLMEGSRMPEFLKENECKDVDEFIERLAKGEPRKKSPFGQQ